jgi:hypothetical protein
LSIAALHELDWVIVGDFRAPQHAREDLALEVPLVAQGVCTAMDDANLVVRAHAEFQRDLVLGFAVGGDD